LALLAAHRGATSCCPSGSSGTSRAAGLIGAVERPAAWAVTPRARKSIRTFHAGPRRVKTAPRTRVDHRGVRPVRRKRRPPAAVDNPASGPNVLHGREGSPV